MVSLRYYDTLAINCPLNLCGGSIVSEIVVLTATNYIYAEYGRPHRFSVRAGVFDITNADDENGQVRSLTQVIVHLRYDSRNYLNDVALARADPLLEFNRVNAIPLPNVTNLEDSELTAVGSVCSVNRRRTSPRPSCRESSCTRMSAAREMNRPMVGRNYVHRLGGFRRREAIGRCLSCSRRRQAEIYVSRSFVL